MNNIIAEEILTGTGYRAGVDDVDPIEADRAGEIDDAASVGNESGVAAVAVGEKIA